MVEQVRGSGNVGGTQATDLTTGAEGPRGSSGPTMSNSPGAIEIDIRQWAAPPLDPPQIDLKTLNERYTGIRTMLDTGQVRDMAQIMQQIQELQQALDSEQVRNQKIEIESNKVKIDASVNAQMQKISEAEDKMKAQETWNTFMKIFSVAAAVLSVIGTVATAVATGGLTLPVTLAITASSIGAAVAVLQATGADKMIFDALKVPDNARMWISLGISAAIFVMNLPSILQAVKSAVQAASGLINAASKGLQGAEKVMTAAEKVATVASFGRSVSELSQGGMKIGESVTAYQGAEIEHDRKREATRQIELRQMTDDLMDELKELMEKMEESMRGTAEVVQQQALTTQFLVRSGV